MSELRDDAFLLRRIAYGDSSSIIHVLTRSHGLLTLMARGARRSKSPFRACLQPLYELQLVWRAGRTGMGNLVDVDRGREMVAAEQSPEGLQLCALAAQLCQEGDPQGFAGLQRAFALLAGRPASTGMLAGAWLLLDEHGLIGPLDHCWHCGRQAEDMGWHEAECRCAECGGGMALTAGFRRAVPACVQSPRVAMSSADLTMWTRIIQDVLRRHGMRPMNLA